MWSRSFDLDKDLCQRNPSNTPNIFLNFTENILDVRTCCFSEHPNFYSELTSSFLEVTLLFKDIYCKIFSVDLKNLFEVSERFLNQIFVSIKELRPYDMPIRLYTRKSEKS